MGLKTDLVLIGALVGGLVLFKDQIGGAFAKAGETVGGAFGNLFEGISSGFQFDFDNNGETFGFESTDKADPGFLAKDPIPEGGTVFNPEGQDSTTIKQDEFGDVFVNGELVQEGNTETFLDKLRNTFGFLIPSIPEAGAEESNIRPEDQIDNFPPAPATEEDININTALNQETQDQQISDVQTIDQPTTSLLPTDQQFQTFSVEGSNIVGGTIFENPVDTLSEILKFFPELTASQAADLLNQFETEFDRPIFPSDIQSGFIDPDVKNIAANVEGENIQVDTVTTQSELQSEEQKAACITCELYGLNCSICNGGQ